MSIIKLKNVSKFYYKKGVIAIGFTRVNLNFDMGEFVAITGESGSGKSTLLNVISGLDTYEEGEMYINGEETSHYTEKDFENYRRKYIGNIFQNFNLINSYTVYQNIELVLLLNGKKKKEIKKQVLELIKKVGLYRFRKTKVSKLSGGQKQRVAIARALAKNTPIIIADEPTGNLDSKAAKEIIKLLSDISKEKLVIIVTHNYEQVEEYVTRKIKMHDGHVLEDKIIKEEKIIKNVKESSYKTITFFNKLRIAFRNTFNIIPKFLLLLFVYLFITVAIISEYASFKEQEYIQSTMGSNYIFSDISDKRIIITKEDGSSFTNDDYNKIEKMNNIDYIVKNDLLLDSYINLTDDEKYWIGGSVDDIDNFRGDLSIGRMPENDNEIVVFGNPNDYYIGYKVDEIFDRELYFQNIITGELEKNASFKIVGIKYNENTNDYNNKMYLNNNQIETIGFQINRTYSKVKYLFQNKYYSLNNYDNNILPNSLVPMGKVYISSDNNYLCPYEYCIGSSFVLNIDNIYYTDNLELTVDNTYNKWNISSLLNIDNFEDYNGTIFISYEDYNNLFNKDNYQSSVFVKNTNKLYETEKKLNNAGFKTLLIKDSLVSYGGIEVIKILSTVVTIVLIVVLFFISYFVIKIILKSRNKYFSTLRILGSTVKISKQLLIMELFIVSNIAYFGFMLFLYLNSIGILDIKFVSTILNYLKFRDYLILYFILITMSYLISSKFSKKLFKKSAISTLGEEI